MAEGGVSDPEGPLKDHGARSQRQPLAVDDDSTGHSRERWEDQQAMYIGLRYPEDRKKRKRRKHSRAKSTDDSSVDPSTKQTTPPPSERVASILGRDEDEDDEDKQTHEIFCEMEELRPSGDDGEMEWKETARWIRFEEDVEEGGERWSKPHVATLSLHALFELRKGLQTGTVMLDADATSVLQISDLILDNMVASSQLDALNRDKVGDSLLMKHRHQHQRREGKGIPMIRSLADIGRKMSARNFGEAKDSSAALRGTASEKQLGDALQDPGAKENFLSPTGKGSAKDLGSEISREVSSADMSDPHKYNQHFIKKIPAGAEASNILVGELDCLTSPLFAFVRLQKSVMFADITEVPVPTRFMFILLGPQGNQQKFHEIGRSIGTLMSDEVFHDVAYKARDRSDLLAGIDEFLDCVTVLPPGEWDPTIRIEPPKSVPSQEKRKKPPVNGQTPGGLPNGKLIIEDEPEEHGDSSLVRTGRIFGGLINDVKTKLPWYWSDFKDSLHIQCVAAFFFMYFACLTPIITFGGLLGAATDNYIAAMESLVSGAICGISYHLFGGQPLTIVGSTGPVLVFESIVFRFCCDNRLNYLEFRFWIGMWLCFFLLLLVAFDLSALVRYITRFTEESFAMLIAIIFIYEAFKKQFESAHHHPVNLHPNEPLDYNCSCDVSQLNLTDDARHDVEDYFNEVKSNLTIDGMKSECNGTLTRGCFTPRYEANVFFFSCLIFLGTFALSYALKLFRNTRFFPNKVRVLVSDFAVFTAICLMVFVDFMVGLGTDKLLVPQKFEPTKATHRGWIVNPFGSNPWWCFFAGFPPALLATILIFMDQQITSVIINRKEHKLRKGCGYHLDLLLITVQIGVCTLLGTPWFVAATVLSINHVRALTRETESAAPGERPKFLGIREQRVTGTLVFIMVGLSAFLASVLKHIPMSVLYGVFLFMGISSLKGIQFVQRVMVMFMPAKYQPDYMFLRNVPVRRVHLFTFVQILCLSGLCVIKEIESISIVFPLMVLAMCFIRKSLDYVFTRHELKWLDDIMPESHKREKEEKKKKLLESAAEQFIEEVAAIAVPEAGAQIKLAVFSPGETSGESQIRHRKGGDRDIEKGAASGPSITVATAPPAGTKSQQPVRFKIADDDEEDDKPKHENVSLLDKPPPYILIESPSANKLSGAGDGSSPTHV